VTKASDWFSYVFWRGYSNPYVKGWDLGDQ